jgi:hypothetical protein
MTTVVLNRPRRRASREHCTGERGHGLTLEQSLGATLTAVRAGDEAECPLCPGTMRAVAGTAVCESCGSELS